MGAGAKAVKNAKQMQVDTMLVVRNTVSKWGGSCLAHVPLGSTVWGTPRKLNILVKLRHGKQFAVECMFQDNSGTAEQKFFAKLYDNKTTPMLRLIVFAGDGFSERFKTIMQSHGAVALEDLKDWLETYCSSLED